MGAKLILTPAGFKTWEVVEDFEVSINNFSFIVPKGFKTDLASVPRIFWALIPPFGRYSQAAVVHDYLYRVEHDRKEADEIFYDLMIKYETWKWKARVMFWGVRMFGGFCYGA